MLRPEQMSKVSVTGAKSVMNETIETLHNLQLVHITDYDGSWDGFEPGESLEGADETSGTLVTVRSIESILGVSDEDAGSTAVSLDDPAEQLEEIRTEVNELDDKRDELRSRQREIEERLDQMELFADLGLDLDLLWGYDSLEARVGEGDPAQIRDHLEENEDIDAYEVFSGDESVAVFARETVDGALEDAMVGVPFTQYEVPEKSGDPAANVSDLQQERKRIEADLEKVESELESIKLENADFLLALEEKLTIDAQKYEAPLRFATTERSFIVEGWIPTEEYGTLTSNLQNRLGDRVEVEELERAAYTSSGHMAHDDVHDANHPDEEVATDGGEQTEVDDQRVASDGGETVDDVDEEPEVATDGGTAEGYTTVQDDPPVIQRNSRIVNPFEVLTQAINRPRYSEFDPTFIVFVTFPFFFGWMIGDMGYGLVYVLLGYWVYGRFDSEAVSNIGAVVAWMGLWTTLFGVLYGELFGLHLLEQLGTDPVFHKGLSELAWAELWLVFSVFLGLVHLNIGYLFQLVEEYQLHGGKPALLEAGSWILMLNGIWVFIFSKTFMGAKPDFVAGPDAALASHDYIFNIGFTGFPATIGWLGIAAFFAGLVLLAIGPTHELVEGLVPLVHVLSYTRLMAVLLSKAGMALAANLLYFGAYRDDHGFHFMHTKDPSVVEKKIQEGSIEEGEMIFNGLFNMGSTTDIGFLTLAPEGAILGLPVLIVAQIVVLAIGGTAALQAIRLEYVEFFEKFYEGGGKNYQPFGYDRTYTTDN
jgi:V/A-type H+-transporting ATPase subunit I